MIINKSIGGQKRDYLNVKIKLTGLILTEIESEVDQEDLL